MNIFIFLISKFRSVFIKLIRSNFTSVFDKSDICSPFISKLLNLKIPLFGIISLLSLQISSILFSIFSSFLKLQIKSLINSL